MARDWICCQIGAREHYAVPRALHQSGRLARLYTDFWAGPLLRRCGGEAYPATIRSLSARFHPGLASEKVSSWNARTVWSEAQETLRPRRDKACDRFARFLEVGRRFGGGVREALSRRSKLGADSVFFAYDTGALEAMQWCKDRGIRCVLDQMDPNRVEVEMVRMEQKIWPGWENRPMEVPEEYFQRREEEWNLADRILVNSEFCRKALEEQGVPPQKLVVIPLSYEPDKVRGTRNSQERPSVVPLRVLFLGQVILRKGVQYLMEAARRMQDEDIRFDVVGPVGISGDAAKSAPKNMTFHGRVGRQQAGERYLQSHVFVLPTLSDGFAITQLEAMSHGLPVIATRSCGAAVTDEVDGLIVPPRDVDALVNAFKRYLADPGLVRRHGAAALEKSEHFTLDRLADNLRELESALR